MKKELEQAQIAVKNLLNSLEDLKKVEVLEGIKPKFLPNQEVWIINKKFVPSWYKMPVQAKSFEDGFEKVTVMCIHIGKNSNLNYRDCAVGEHKDQIGIAYKFGWYSDGNVEQESQVWGSLKEAMESNQKQFEDEFTKYINEKEKQKQEEKRRLEEKLKDLQ